MPRKELFGYLFAIALALSPVACAALGSLAQLQSDTEITFDEAVAKARPCGSYEGITFWVVDPGSCPDYDYMVRPVEKYLKRFHARVDEFSGAQLIFVSQPLLCDRIRASGCALYQIMVVRHEGWASMWGSYVQHEMGHALAWRRHSEGDIHHKRPYYPEGIW